MKGWIQGAGNPAHLRLRNSRIFMNDAAPLIREVIKKGIRLRGVVTGRRRQLFPKSLAALDQRLTEIFVVALFSMSRMRFPFIRVGERQAVRAPLGEQKNKERRRQAATEVSIGSESAIAPHGKASLAILRLGEQDPWLGDDSFEFLGQPR